VIRKEKVGEFLGGINDLAFGTTKKDADADHESISTYSARPPGGPESRLSTTWPFHCLWQLRL